MGQFQRVLLSIFLLVLFITFIYLLIKWFLRSRKKIRITKMVTMNLVVKYKPFLEYLDYNLESKNDFDLFLVSLNNFSLLTRKYKNEFVRTYLRKLAKDLSVYLPYGGKIAQTNVRNVFLLYVPNKGQDLTSFGQELKDTAENVYYLKTNIIQKNVSIAILEGSKFSKTTDLNKLKIALVNSNRNLGEITYYHEDLKVQTNEYDQVLEKIAYANINYDLFPILKDENSRENELFIRPIINDSNLVDFINSLPLLEQAWANMYIIEGELGLLYENNINMKVNIPVVTSILEKELFIDAFTKTVESNQFRLENISVSLNLVNINDETMIIKNILSLISLGVKISLEVKTISPELFILIRNFNIKRIIINDKLLLSDKTTELLYFSKINNLEVLVTTNDKELKDTKELNVTSIAMFDRTLSLINLQKKKRGIK